MKKRMLPLALVLAVCQSLYASAATQALNAFLVRNVNVSVCNVTGYY